MPEHERLVQLGVRGQRIDELVVQRRVVGHRDLADDDGRQRLLGDPASRVEQALAVHRRHRDVDDEQLLAELRTPGDEVALGVEGERRAVEDELVLAADLVDVDERRVGVGGAGRQHPLAVGGLAAVVRRGVDVHRQLGAAVGLHGERAVGAPHVLADADADLDPADLVQLERVGLVPGREVAGLVEHGVVGQQALAVRADDLAARAAPRRR